MEKFEHDMIEEHNTDSIVSVVATAVVMFFTWAADAFMQNPIGTAGAITGLLYMFEKWRTQKALRKKAEHELETKKEEDNGEGA